MISTVTIVLICIGAFLVLLCIVTKILSTKYIRGDFSNDKDGDEEEDALLDQPYYDDEINNKDDVEIGENEKKNSFVEKDDEEMIIHFDEDDKQKRSSVQLYAASDSHTETSSIHSKEEIGEENRNDQKTPFLHNTKLKSELQFNESSRCIKGTFTSLVGLNTQSKDAPHDINFHLKVIPGNRFRMKTRFRTVSQIISSRSFALSFTMGPLQREVLNDAKLSVKLYGKKSGVLSGHKCYGKLYISLDNLAENDEPIVFSTPFLSQGVSGQDNLDLTSESEPEN